MDRLVVLREGVVTHLLELAPGELSIGRDAANHVVLDHPSVSRNHARLVSSGDSWTLSDLGSTNGILIDGKFVGAGQLAVGAIAQVGAFALQLVRLPGGPARSVPAAPQPEISAPFKALEALYLLSGEFSTLLSIGDLLEKMIDCLVGIFRAERGFILLYHPRSGKLEPAIVRKMEKSELSDTVSMTVAMHAATEKKPVLLDDLTATARFQGARSIERERIRSILAAPLVDGSDVLGVVYLDSQMKSRKFTAADLEILEVFCRHASSAVKNANEKDQLRRDLFRLQTLEHERELTEYGTDQIVGASSAMEEVRAQIRALGAEEVTTLILGESGTGKELVARAIHAASARREKPFVAVNCMALSPTLVESELFGHEKGAF
ncbi:MAG: sigma 54-interacting transcriptional regulator, partial [Candidatus Wallbacteria bacterium]|nr:sigma 54-interacting transcriptional regulator [Candidatus Wallbacteria bacterium]